METSTSKSPRAASPSRTQALRFWERDPWSARLVVVMIALLIFFAAVRPQAFFSGRTWTSMAVQFPEFGLMALGVMVTMFTAGIDLSVVAIANVTAICTALTLRAVLTPEVSATNSLMAVAIALGTALVVGIVCGAINGLLIAKLKIPAILATLGTLELFGGIAIVLTGGKPVSGVPKAYGAVFAAKIGGVVPMALIVFILCALVAGALLALTSFGKEILMLGTNETAARFSGMKISSLLVRTYVMSGVLAAMAGLVMLANYNSAKADYGATYTLLTVLIVVLGGVNPNGGKGRLLGVLLSILMLQVLSSGLNMFSGISNFYRPLIWGAVLLFVITVNEMNIRNPLERFLPGRNKS
ncbi:ABC transporter permease [Schaalia sp. 19OD2882]|uniref:ABC transporter permease n=1 Tax=Schaalia sp. 19OD2882 TaxID=2794089 RepID=UPI001C1EC4E2|nr:ABC transporter permease [Schaalia sp. 19OD2882]QWW19647.1 ABC transporter permease [Schaalia sp. 19OD2882]